MYTSSMDVLCCSACALLQRDGARLTIMSQDAVTSREIAARMILDAILNSWFLPKVKKNEKVKECSLSSCVVVMLTRRLVPRVASSYLYVNG